MPLTPATDISAASWLTTHAQPWPRLALFGPPVFVAYARLRLIPDPTEPGQQEGDVETEYGEHRAEINQMRRLINAMQQYTTTPEDAYHCLWEGWGDLRGEDPEFLVNRDTGARRELPRAEPAFPPEVLNGAMVRHEHRDYFLFRGPLSQLGDWGAAQIRPGVPREALTPAFVWPVDHVWCVAKDIDPHWAGIGAPEPVVAELLTLPDLDIVEADPSQPQPCYG